MILKYAILLLSLVPSTYQSLNQNDLKTLNDHFSREALSEKVLSYTKSAEIFGQLPTIKKENIAYSDILNDPSILDDNTIATQFDQANANGGITEVKSLAAALNIKKLLENVVVQTAALESTAKVSTVHGINSNERCCNLYEDTGEMEYDSFFRSVVDKSKMCVMGECEMGRALSGVPSCHQSVMGQEFLNTMRNHERNEVGRSAWQYFGSATGAYSVYPSFVGGNCYDETYDPRLRPWYLNALSQKPLDLVIIFDKSGSMSYRNRMEMTKNAVTAILSMLRPTDRVAVSPFSSDHYINVETKIPCQTTQLSYATNRNIKALQEYVSTVQAGGGTSYVSAINFARKYFTNTDYSNANGRQKVLVFISDGEANEPDYEIMDQLKVLIDENPQLLMMVYGLDIENALLRQMANHGYGRQGEFYTLTPDNIKLIVGQFYMHPDIKSSSSNVQITLPYLDSMGMGLMVTASKAVIKDNILQGVVGYDVTMDYLLKPIKDLLNIGQYAFLIDSVLKNVIYHPELSAPEGAILDPFHYKIYESNPVLAANIDNMVDNNVNFVKFTTNIAKTFLIDNGMRISTNNPNVNYISQNDKTIESLVICRKIVLTGSDTSYILCLIDQTAAMQDGLHELDLDTMQNTPTNFRYHEDFNTNTPKCSHGLRSTTEGKVSVKFAPRQFKEPARYLYDNEYINIATLNNIIHKVDNNNIYFDNLKSVIITSYISEFFEPIWKEINDNLSTKYESVSIENLDITQDSPISVWKYFGFDYGTFRINPGIKVANGYDPTQRPWYKLALTDASKTFISLPYIDAFGMGYVVTISQAFSYSEGAVAGVLGSDYFLSQIGSLVEDNFEICKTSGNTCMLIDSSGAIVWWKEFKSDPKIIETTRNDYKGESISGNLMVDLVGVGGSSIGNLLIEIFDVKKTKCNNVLKVSTRTTLDLNSLNLNGNQCISGMKNGININICILKGTNVYFMTIDSELEIIDNSDCSQNIYGCSLSTFSDEEADNYSPCWHSYSEFEKIPVCQGAPVSYDVFKSNKTFAEQLQDAAEFPTCFNWMWNYRFYVIDPDNPYAGRSMIGFLIVPIVVVLGGLGFLLQRNFDILGLVMGQINSE